MCSMSFDYPCQPLVEASPSGAILRHKSVNIRFKLHILCLDIGLIIAEFTDYLLSLFLDNTKRMLGLDSIKLHF